MRVRIEARSTTDAAHAVDAPSLSLGTVRSTTDEARASDTAGAVARLVKRPIPYIARRGVRTYGPLDPLVDRYVRELCPDPALTSRMSYSAKSPPRPARRPLLYLPPDLTSAAAEAGR